MADEAKQFLAVNVLNEERTVSYRTLSRALKIHANLAKQALFEFHQRQNARKAGSVHATYLLTGKRKPQQPMQTNGSHSQDTDGDSFMHSSQLLSSQPEQSQDNAEDTIPVTTVLLVKEEDLEAARESFEELASIHVYSLQPVSPQNVQALSDCNRDVLIKYRSEDPLEAWKQYGTIQNPEVRRRKLGIRPQDSIAKPTAAAPTKAAPKPAPAAPIKDEKPAAAAAAAKPAPVESRAEAINNAPTLKKEKSDLFKSFAKAKPKKETKGGAAEDNSMLMDDDEDDGNDMDIDVSGPKEISEEQRKAEAEKQEQLRRMMDDDEDETPKDVAMDDALEEGPVAKEDEEEVQGAPLDKKDDPKEEKEATVTVSGGRRRGRRRVMKKKTVKDEDGYLVTKEEAEWESFSEDEPEAKKPKMAPVNAASKTKKAARPGQGNIMSFFKKG